MATLFQLESSYKPAGSQPEAISKLVSGVQSGLAKQVLLGVTGSGKTFTMAHVIATLGRPALIMAPNKTLAAQLYREFKEYFPTHAVEYFVSYYDYYQPEAYVPASDTFIEKDAAINEHIEQMRLSATKALVHRPDVIIVATVSAIYGLGDPEAYLQMILHLSRHERIDQRDILKRLTALQYTRTSLSLARGQFRVQGDVVDVFPAEEEKLAIRIELFDDEIVKLALFDPLTGVIQQSLPRVTIFPKTHYVTPRERLLKAVDAIQEELRLRLPYYHEAQRYVEAQRLSDRTRFDIEMMLEMGYCTGIENYSRYLSGRAPGEGPPTLFDYLPPDALLMIDESHVTVPQIGGMYRGDRARKETLVEYGFRLPSALDNRPLRFEEFEARSPQTIYVSATPGPYEIGHAEQIIEQVVRPTGLVDPSVEVRPVLNQVDDLLSEIHATCAQGARVLVTTLTKRMAEDLTEYLHEKKVKVRYLHSDVNTVERVEIIRDLRLGMFDVLIGINLLREGLDIPEVALVAILDADKEGFLRSDRALIQTIGRAARHIAGRVILYADRITGSMARAMEETERRRSMQRAYNVAHGITPVGIVKQITDILEVRPVDEKPEASYSADPVEESDPVAILHSIRELEKTMHAHAKNMEFEAAAVIRDQCLILQAKLKTMKK